jgi:GlpG protein
MDHSTGPTGSQTPPNTWPWVTQLAVVWCILVWAGITAGAEKKGLTPELMISWGWSPAGDVWNGSYLSLLTSVFVHHQLWHLAFNCYWLLMFGTLLERRLGTLQYSLFFASAAFVSSSFELGISSETGIGASGVIYAMFGVLWPLRKRWPEVAEHLSGIVIIFALIWLVACVILTRANILPIGNSAHFSGMTFGLAIAGLIRSWRKRVSSIVIFSHIALALLFVLWCPWSVDWLTHRAYKLHAEKRYHDAIQVYSKIIAKEPENSWAFHNRASANQSLGRDREAASDLETATRLDARAEK